MIFMSIMTMLERPLFKQQMTIIVVGLDQVWYIKEHWLRGLWFVKKKVAAQLRFAGQRNTKDSILQSAYFL